MTRLISTTIILTLVIVTGLVLTQTGASGALPSGLLPIAAPTRATTPSLDGTPTPARMAPPTGEPKSGVVIAPRTGAVSAGNPAEWQAPGQTSSPDADPLTEAGRWEWTGGGTFGDIFFVDRSYGWAAGPAVGAPPMAAPTGTVLAFGMEQVLSGSCLLTEITAGGRAPTVAYSGRRTAARAGCSQHTRTSVGETTS